MQHRGAGSSGCSIEGREGQGEVQSGSELRMEYRGAGYSRCCTEGQRCQSAVQRGRKVRVGNRDEVGSGCGYRFRV